jgi:hypothetical protein
MVSATWPEAVLDTNSPAFERGGVERHTTQAATRTREASRKTINFSMAYGALGRFLSTAPVIHLIFLIFGNN